MTVHLISIFLKDCVLSPIYDFLYKKGYFLSVFCFIVISCTVENLVEKEVYLSFIILYIWLISVYANT